jgi:hypothetical protein
LLTPVALVAVLVLVLAGSGTSSVNPTQFIELDANAFVDLPSPGLDWSCLFHPDAVPGIPDAGCKVGAPTPISQDFKTDATIPFGTGGSDDQLGQGSKDIQPIECAPGSQNCWSGVVSPINAKDDLEHAGWAAYEDPVNHHIITYFVADRYSNNGSSFIGEWFFKGNVTRNADGTYNGNHVQGDTLVLVDNAGNATNAPSEVGVYQWDTGCGGSPTPPTGNLGLPCAAANLAQVLAVGAADCRTATNPDACAAFNTSGLDTKPTPVNVPSAWHFQTNTSGAPANLYDTSEFVEGAVDLTALLGPSNTCFSTTQAETRSSNSPSASLQDVVMGKLTTCGTINIVKDATPNGSTSFPFTASGLTSPSPDSFNLVDDGTTANTKTYLDVVPTTDGGGPYSAAEGTLPTGWSLTGASCDNGSPVTAITVSRGQTVTCTFTNVEQAKLHVIKVVNNTHGGTLAPGNFTVHVQTGSPLADVTGSPHAGQASPGTLYSVDPGTYTVSENTPPTGYQQVSIVCDGVATATITLAPGDDKTCTITNADIAPKLHVIKVVNNTHGGTLGPADFTVHVKTGAPLADVSGSPQAGASAPGTLYTLNAGSYTVSENTPPTGYQQVSIVCDGVTTATVTLAVGDDKTCTITNADIAPKLHVIKVVNNNNGGTLGPADFMVHVETGSPLADVSGSPQAGASAPGTLYTLSAGSYTVSENTPPTGYQQVSIVCNGVTTASVTLAVGDDKTCTITNADIAPKLHVIKVVNNTHGGTLGPADFMVHVKTGAPLADVSGSPQAGASAPGTLYTLSAGSYTVSENTPPSGYEQVSITCNGVTTATVTLAVGDDKTCTITNRDIAPKLHVIKVVNNTHGGTLGPADFTVHVKTGAPLADVSGSPQAGASAPGTLYTLSAGSYTVSENTPPTGYQQVSIVCNGVTTATVTLAVGDDKTCTITNSDMPGHAKVIKTVLGVAPTGTQSFLFEIRKNASATQAGTLIEGPTAANAGNGGTITFTTNLSAGTYNLCEQVIPGWQQSFTGYGLYNPNDDLGYVCVDFTVKIGQTTTINVDNTPPPGGNAATIGYWKNHAPVVCKKSNGGQTDALSIALGSGFFLGPYDLTDACKAVQLLNKNNINGVKEPGDIIYSMVAQLVAVHLNLNSGGGTCTQLTTAIGQANTLLTAIGFDGVKSFLNKNGGSNLTPSQQTQAASLNTLFDSYNNNNLIGC